MEAILLSEKRVRGLLGVLVDLLGWLRIYRQRVFWIQIAAVTIGVFLWIPLSAEVITAERVAAAVAAAPILILLNAIMTNVVWAISRKPYSCVIGGSIGYGLYNFAVGAIQYSLSITDILVKIFLGMIYGFVFSWFAFIIFYFIGLIKIVKKKEEQTQSQT